MRLVTVSIMMSCHCLKERGVSNMVDCVVLDWLRMQKLSGVDKSYTIKEVYKALLLTKNKRCLEIVWRRMAKLREEGLLVTTWTIPVRYKLK